MLKASRKTVGKASGMQRQEEGARSGSRVLSQMGIYPWSGNGCDAAAVLHGVVSAAQLWSSFFHLPQAFTHLTGALLSLHHPHLSASVLAWL